MDVAVQRTTDGLESHRQGHQAERLTASAEAVLSFTFGLALLAIVSMFVAACMFAHPIADDLDFASAAHEAGLVTAWRQQYLTWNGRYTSNLLALMVPIAGGALAPYGAPLAAMLAAIAGAVYALLRAAAGASLTRIQAAAAALTVTALYLCEMPSLGEGVYWYTSAVTYQAAIVAAVLHAACVVRTRRGGLLTFACALVLLAAAVGFNEVVMLMMLAAYAALLGAVVVQGRPGKAPFVILLAVAAASALIVACSPGNAARVQEYPLRHQVGRSLAMTGLQTIRFLAAWLSSGPLLIASLLWLPIADRLLSAAAVRPHQRLALRLCLAGILLVVPLAAFPAYWATGTLGQQRTMNLAWFAFLVLWFGMLALWSASGSLRATAACALAAPLRTPLALLLVMSLALTHNSYSVGSDFVTGRFRQFDREMQARDRTLDGCRNDRRTACDIDPIRTRPASFFVLDITDNPRNWVNVAYARYYHVGQVRMRADSHKP
jgi:hypothetical protein